MFDLETAANPQKLRRVAIDPVSRVEGHGKVTLLLDDDNKVHQVRLHIVEFRGFEVFIEGRPFWEVPVMVQRLCGICPVSHHLAAVKAMDIIAGTGGVLAQHCQDHTMAGASACCHESVYSTEFGLDPWPSAPGFRARCAGNLRPKTAGRGC